MHDNPLASPSPGASPPPMPLLALARFPGKVQALRNNHPPPPTYQFPPNRYPGLEFAAHHIRTPPPNPTALREPGTATIALPCARLWPPAASSRDPGYPGPLSQNRTSAVHIRLFRTMDFPDFSVPTIAGRVATSPYPSASFSCAGATTCSGMPRQRSSNVTRPNSVKYAFRRPRCTTGI